MIGEKLKSLREAYNLSQKEVASKLNISNTALSNYEKNLRDPDTPLIIAYAHLLDLPVAYLFNYFYNESVHESYEVYRYDPDTNQDINFTILSQEKINELPLTELLKIKEYAELIYKKHRNAKK
jgi:transcriptional regulator with XRE-family HTH domain